MMNQLLGSETDVAMPAVVGVIDAPGPTSSVNVTESTTSLSLVALVITNSSEPSTGSSPGMLTVNGAGLISSPTLSFIGSAPTATKEFGLGIRVISSS